MKKSSPGIKHETSDVALEVEVLGSTYGQENILYMLGSTGEPGRVTVHLKPHTGDDDTSSVFVETRLTLGPPGGYPNCRSPVCTSLEGSKGLDEEREAALKAELVHEAVAMAGELVLGHLCEVAKDYLTRENRPHGLCIFCREDMHSHGGTEAHDTSNFLKLPCFHAYHKSCFVSWWAWQQRAWAEQERDLVAHTGATSVATLLATQLPPKEPHHAQLYCATCPVCRMPFALDDLPWVSAELCSAVASARPHRPSTHREAGVLRAVPAAAPATHGTGECGMVLEAEAAAQRRRRELFERQLARGGIIGGPEPPPCEPAGMPGNHNREEPLAAHVSDRAGDGGRQTARQQQQQHHQRRRHQHHVQQQQQQQLGRGAGDAGRGTGGGRGDGGSASGGAKPGGAHSRDPALLLNKRVPLGCGTDAAVARWQARRQHMKPVLSQQARQQQQQQQHSNGSGRGGGSSAALVERPASGHGDGSSNGRSSGSSGAAAGACIVARAGAGASAGVGARQSACKPVAERRTQS